MASPSAPTDSVLTARPIVSELEHGATGRLFSIRFESGQRLPPHRNAARVIMTAVAGSGEILITGDGMRVLPCGAVVQLDPDVEHSVVAGTHGLELRVELVANCCEHC